MTEKARTLWRSMDRRIIVNQRELVLGVTVCTLAGILTGIFLSPRKHVTIGSYNSGNGTVLAADTDEEAEEE